MVWPYFHTPFYACYTQYAFSSHVRGFHDGFFLLSPFILTLQSIYSTPLSLLTPFPHLSFVILTLHLHIFATHLLHSITSVQCNNETRWCAMIGQNTSEIVNLTISLHLVQMTCCKTWLMPVDVTSDQMQFASKFPTAAASIWEFQFRNVAEKQLFSLHTFILSRILRKTTSTVDIASLCNLRSSK